MKRDLHALARLTRSHLQRLMREGIVVRSLAFPVVLTGGTLMLTLAVVAWDRASPVVAVHEHDRALVPALQAIATRPVVVDDPVAAFDDGDAWAAIAGDDLYLSVTGRKALAVEGVLRDARGAAWRPDPEVPLPAAPAAAAFGKRVAALISGVYALYGVVFGAGIVARDREGGTLEVEATLGVRRWVHGTSRWIAASAVLVVFVATGLAGVDALLGTGGLGPAITNGAAAILGATALGTAAMGAAGPRSRFSGPLSAALIVATALFGLGYAVPAVGQWLPMASLAASGDGIAPLLVGLLFGAAAGASLARADAA